MMRCAGSSVLAALLLLPSTPGLSQTAAAPEPEKTVCRRFVETGQITPKRVCLTRIQWAAVRKMMANRRPAPNVFVPIQLERGL